MNALRIFLIHLCVSTLLVCCSHSNVGANELAELQHQREVFITLERLAANPNTSKFKQFKQQLDGYPLEPYIELATLKAFPNMANKEKIDQFLTAYRGTPLDWPLRSKWLEYLKSENYADLFLAYFKPTANVELTCQSIVYQLDNDDLRDQLMAQIEQLWLVGQSQPNECDPAFAYWTKAGLRTEQHVLQRLALVGQGGNHSLIPYLKTLLPVDKQYLADRWLQVRRDPSFVSRLSKFPMHHPEIELEILQYGVNRLVWRNPDLAIKIWLQVVEKYDVPVSAQRQVAGKFAVALTIEEHNKADEWLKRATYDGANEELFRWHLAHVLKIADWQRALEVIDQMPTELAEDLSVKYWQARALEQLDATENALATYHWLAKHRHYYGFLASGKLAQEPNIVDKPLDFDTQTLSEVANRPAAKRAYELLQLERYTMARREWFYLQSTLNPQQKLVSAVLADSWQWHDRAIYGFSNTGYLDDVKRRFPMAFRQEFVNQAQTNQIDPAWAFAIARRESSFMPDANSSAGAKGLMQLLPGTARYLAKKKISSRSLYDPDTNTGYGTQYLRYLMDKMDNNPVLATASYNAGWRRVQQWIPKQGQVPVDVWIETIPYKETRNYVKAVLAYRQIYASQLGKKTPLFSDMVNMQLGQKAD